MSKAHLGLGMAMVSMSLMLAPHANAENDTLDLGSLTCKEMMKLADRDREAIMGFYFGHAAATKKTSVLDLNAASETAVTVIEDCLSNPGMAAMNVFMKRSK